MNKVQWDSTRGLKEKRLLHTKVLFGPRTVTQMAMVMIYTRVTAVISLNRPIFFSMWYLITVDLNKYDLTLSVTYHVRIM
jgi:hypothetical protein